MKKLVIALLIMSLAVPCFATTRLMKLAEDRYLITHQKQSFYGGQGKALRLTYEKAGSLCEILGFSYFEIKDTQSKGRGFRSGAGATVEVKLHHEKGDDKEDELLNCKDLATAQQKEKMKKALEKMKE